MQKSWILLSDLLEYVSIKMISLESLRVWIRMVLEIFLVLFGFFFNSLSLSRREMTFVEVW